MTMIGKSDFTKEVARTIREISDRYDKNSNTAADNPQVKEQVIRDLDKIADIREKGERF
jgi:hypothetical protein